MNASPNDLSPNGGSPASPDRGADTSPEAPRSAAVDDTSGTPPPAPPRAESSEVPNSTIDSSETFDPENGLRGAEEPDAESTDPDAETVAAALAGDQRAFETLVLKHQDRVYTNIYFMVHDKELAADLSQECFLRAYRGLRSFQGRSRFATWLKRIAVNVTLHHFEKARAQKRSATVLSISQGSGDEDDGGMQIAADGRAPDEALSDLERRQAIERAVGELEPEYRTALALRELHGYSYREITEALSLPIGTVKSKIFRARQILQEKLKDLL